MDFEDPDPETARRQEACDAIVHRMRDGSHPSRPYPRRGPRGCRRFYAEEGYPDAWMEHHQGGITGYASREVVATPETAPEDRNRPGLRVEPLAARRERKKHSFLQ